MGKIYLVISTFDSNSEARQLGRILVEQQLAICSQISGPITSCYLWKGQVEEAVEYKLTMKVRADKLESLKSNLEHQHSYDTPMIIIIEADDVNQAYLDWAYDPG